MELHRRFVDEIHARLLVRYGSKWLNLWAGVPEEAIKADWSEQLAAVTPAGVRFALDNLPDEYPPTVGAFRALCLTQQRPELQAPALPAPAPAEPGLFDMLLENITLVAAGLLALVAWGLIGALNRDLAATRISDATRMAREPGRAAA